jgi:hypothetical protein
MERLRGEGGLKRFDSLTYETFRFHNACSCIVEQREAVACFEDFSQNGHFRGFSPYSISLRDEQRCCNSGGGGGVEPVEWVRAAPPEPDSLL